MAGEFYTNSILGGLPPGMERNAQFSQPGPFTTLMSPEHLQMYHQWLQQQGVHLTPDYDMRGFFQAMMNHKASQARDPFDHLMHFPDTFKRPSHETFSRESKYAKPNAPRWVDNKRLLDEKGKLIFEDTGNK